MPKASVKRLIECSKEQLVNLVLDIENYPKFIPYCLDAKIYEKKEKGELGQNIVLCFVREAAKKKVLFLVDMSTKRGGG